MEVLTKRIWILTIEIPEGMKNTNNIKPVMYFSNEELCDQVAMKVLNMGYKILKGFDILNG
jgi:hypothetical protein